MTAYAQVSSVRRGRYVEFLFMINDDDLSLELIMPLPAFREFCQERNAVVVDAHGLLATADDRAVGSTRSGLYRRPDQHPQPQ